MHYFNIQNNNSRTLFLLIKIYLTINSFFILSTPKICIADGIERLHNYLNNLNSLQVNFQQYTFNADHSQLTEARGTCFIQRPGRFRWEYSNPNQQIIIADGQRVYIQDLDLNQVSHRSQAQALRGTPALLLAGEDPLEQNFNLEIISNTTDGREWVALTPREQDTDVVRIEVGFGQTTLESLIMVDQFGQETRLNFTGEQRNLRLKSSLFEIDQKSVNEFLNFD